MRYKDITGKKFGKLTAIKKIGIKNHSSIWQCKCDCGKIKEFFLNNLTTGRTNSCGCLYIKSNQKFRKYNKFVIKNNIVEIELSNTHNRFYIDLEDLEKIKNYCWFESNHGYVINKSNGKCILLHRYLTNCPKDKVIDHLDHNPLNNCKNNLKICSQKENMSNLKIKNTNYLKQFGISEVRRNNNKYYIVQLYNKYQGCFKILDEAINKRDDLLKGGNYYGTTKF